MITCLSGALPELSPCHQQRDYATRGLQQRPGASTRNLCYDIRHGGCVGRTICDAIAAQRCVSQATHEPLIIFKLHQTV